MEGDTQIHIGMSPGSMTSRPSASHSHHSEYSEETMLTPQSIPEPSKIPSIASTRPTIHTEDAAADLLALRYRPSQMSQSQSTSLFLEGRPDMPPPMNMNLLHDLNDDALLVHPIFEDRDGIFLPGSAYQELHSTLRDHLIYTARFNGPTRNGTPEPLQRDRSLFNRGLAKMGSDGSVEMIESDPESARSSKPPEITAQREYILWKTWIDEVAPWVSHPYKVRLQLLICNSSTNSTTGDISSTSFR